MSRNAKRTSASYKRAKYEAYERDGQRCVFCGTNYGLTPAHIIRVTQGGVLDDPANIMIACTECHRKYDSYEIGLPAIVLIRMTASHYDQYEKTRRVNR